jgi:Nucleotidyl transferase AbiEii toxin, Type IV TA system
MTSGFRSIIAASEADLRDIFITAANRLGTTIQNVEKDFWVCWALDALFNGLPEGGPRLLFEGGTSLSKAFGLISRFSEDIDITLFRQDIGQAASIEELESLSGKKRRARLDAIREACQSYIGGPLLENLALIAKRTMQEASISPESIRIELDQEDDSRQSLLLWYPSVLKTPGEYLRSAVKIESGAKSHSTHTNRPSSHHILPTIFPPSIYESNR